MTTDKPARIALLIDADNSPAGKIDVVLAELAKVGVTNIRRAYGNWKKESLKGWEGVLHEYAIRPIQQFDYSKGKNATDMAMVIDALDLLYTDRPEAFGIVSSDSDFTPLVLHLKAKGALMFGFGAAKTPRPFVAACSHQASFDPRNYGYATLSKLIAATQLFDFRAEGTSLVAVRDKRQAKGANTSVALRPAAPAPAPAPETKPSQPEAA